MACGAFMCTMAAVNLPILGGVPTGVIEVDALAPTFESFYVSNSRRLFAALYLVTGNRDEAEEIAEEAFVRVFERWERVGELDDPTGYLFHVSMNVFHGRYRRASLAVRRVLSLAPRPPTTSRPSRPMTKSSACSPGSTGSSARPSC